MPAVGTYIAVDLTENNAHCYPDHDPPPDFGWGVCKHGHGLQEFGDGYMVERIAKQRAKALNAGKQATDIHNIETREEYNARATRHAKSSLQAMRVSRR